VVVYEPYSDEPFVDPDSLTAEVSAEQVRAGLTTADGAVRYALTLDDSRPESVTARGRINYADEVVLSHVSSAPR
ncbi:hypothetical protein, partial [Salmonella sp. SAL4457]|uniref:hypothetical protein n=1 Tax=Salmonella sp. SAL4457 TaxID=3159912 RepID=UPI00397A80EC